jgi:hypothetical protein
MEQRVGRVDRVRSLTERRLAKLERDVSNEEKLQVYFPHLQDTVELLQVQRVLERMNTFLRLMHEGLSTAAPEQRKIDVAREILTARHYVAPIQEQLRSAFPTPACCLEGTIGKLEVKSSYAEDSQQRFLRLKAASLGGLRIDWVSNPPPGKLIGETWRDGRRQPFRLHLRSHGVRLLVHCASPIGRIHPAENHIRPEDFNPVAARIAIIEGPEDTFYDLRVEEDVLLGDPAYDAARVGSLIQRVVKQADDLETKLFPGHDEPLSTFAGELLEEPADGE